MKGEDRLGVLFRQYAETGDENTFGAFKRLADPMFASIAWRVARLNGGAKGEKIEDQLQEIALRLTSNRRDVASRLPESPELAKAYLLKLAANVCRDDWKAARAERRDTSRNVSLQSVEERLEDSGFSKADIPILLSQIDSYLPDNKTDRIIFNFYYKQGYTASEIASMKALNLKVKGVESRLFRITAHLKRKLKESSPAKGNSQGASSL